MGDVRARLATVRARRFNKYGDWSFDDSAVESLRRAEKYFGTSVMHALAVAMAEVLFPAPGRGKKREESGTTRGTVNLDPPISICSATIHA